MTHLVLTDAAIAFLGMPDLPPHLFGLQPIKRQHHGWLFRVESPWLLTAVADILRTTAVVPGARQVRRGLLARLGG